MNELERMREIITILESINVPVGLTQQIAVPIIDATYKLKKLHNDIANTQKEMNDQPEKAQTGDD